MAYGNLFLVLKHDFKNTEKIPFDLCHNPIVNYSYSVLNYRVFLQH